MINNITIEICIGNIDDAMKATADPEHASAFQASERGCAMPHHTFLQIPEGGILSDTA